MLLELSASTEGGKGETGKGKAAAPPAVREVAWKAQCRLSARHRALTRKGRLKTVAVTAVARELSAFIWAINRQIANPGAAAR